jgi:ABC-type Fe3+/spermidine/putrescine transport system ATPase subunit
MSKTLEVRGLNKVYQGAGCSVEALADLTFAVEARELVCVVGPSGCGKTTMLRCVGGLLEPTAATSWSAGRWRRSVSATSTAPIPGSCRADAAAGGHRPGGRR